MHVVISMTIRHGHVLATLIELDTVTLNDCQLAHLHLSAWVLGVVTAVMLSHQLLHGNTFCCAAVHLDLPVCPVDDSPESCEPSGRA